jgi:hypothetical protein
VTSKTRSETDDDQARSTYETERSEAATEAEYWNRRERLFSHLRLGTFAIGAGLAWLAFGSRQIDTGFILPPILVFAGLMIAHDRAIRRGVRAQRIVDFFALGLARLDGSWSGRGNAGARHLDPAHPYAGDLDVFGEGSLFELICTTRTAAGEDLLARWLCAPADAETVRLRQDAVRELTPRLALRRDLALLGEDIAGRISAEALVEWGRGRPVLRPGAHRVVGALLSICTLGGILLWIFAGTGGVPFLFFAALQSGYAAILRARVRHVIASIELPSHDLSVLAGLLARLERETMDSERLSALRGRIETDGVVASNRIAQLQRLVDLLDARRNQFFVPFGALLLWSTQIALALEDWRSAHGEALGPWLDYAAEVEALSAFAGFAYEHPDHVFPEVSEGEPHFEAEGLGHPLIEDAVWVRNDVALGGQPRAWMMSGSNMSGKSTLLRSVGCATLLGLAGAPVCARALRLSPIQIAASIRISDSLQAGASHFYAEITRLRLVVELTEASTPVLFLLDEVLHGTNSHDRRIGAEAVVKGLIARGAIGIVTTHDLALAQIADEMAPRIRNVHFQDQIEDGQMRFDYTLQDGVVTKSNAIELMRSVGLDV